MLYLWFFTESIFSVKVVEKLGLELATALLLGVCCRVIISFLTFSHALLTLRLFSLSEQINSWRWQRRFILGSKPYQIDFVCLISFSKLVSVSIILQNVAALLIQNASLITITCQVFVQHNGNLGRQLLVWFDVHWIVFMGGSSSFF